MCSKAWPAGYWHLFGEPSQLQTGRDMIISKINNFLAVADLQAVPWQHHLLESPTHWTQNTPSVHCLPRISIHSGKEGREEQEKLLKLTWTIWTTPKDMESRFLATDPWFSLRLCIKKTRNVFLLWSSLLKIHPLSSATDSTAGVHSVLGDLLAIQTSLWKLQEIKGNQ